MEKFLNLILFSIAGGLARVWYGADDLPAFWQNRGVQTFFMMFLFMLIYFPRPFNWVGLIIAIILTCWLQFQYWSRGHGICVDMSRGGKPNSEALKRYEDRWYHLICDGLFDKIFKQPNAKYGFLYDWIYTSLRYGCPMLMVSIILQILHWFELAQANWNYIWIGLSVAPIYAISLDLEEKESWVFVKKNWWWRRSWSLAEILSGAITYGGCYLLW